MVLNNGMVGEGIDNMVVNVTEPSLNNAVVNVRRSSLDNSEWVPWQRHL